MGNRAQSSAPNAELKHAGALNREASKVILPENADNGTFAHSFQTGRLNIIDAKQATQTQRPRRPVAVMCSTNASDPNHGTLSTKDAAPEAPAVANGDARALKATRDRSTGLCGKGEGEMTGGRPSVSKKEEFAGFGTVRGRVSTAQKSTTYSIPVHTNMIH